MLDSMNQYKKRLNRSNKRRLRLKIKQHIVEELDNNDTSLYMSEFINDSNYQDYLMFDFINWLVYNNEQNT